MHGVQVIDELSEPEQALRKTQLAFGRYRLLELLGRGGVGEVWRGHDAATDRAVAIRVLPAGLCGDGDFQRRFRWAAHAAAQLETPHAVPTYDYGEIGGRLFVSMRLIRGHDLAAVLTRGPLEPARAVRIIDQVAKALHAAHKVGLIHGDIKPSNILLDDDDFAYLINFGIAPTMDEARRTQTGIAIGSYRYIAPERLAIGADEDARADIYSLACVLYETLTGAPPFPGDAAEQVMAAHVNAPPPRPSRTRPEVPAAVDEVIAAGMAKDPKQRYSTTIELANAARGAITTAIQRSAPSPHRQPPEPAASPVPTPAFPDHWRPQPPPSPRAAAATQLRPELTPNYAPQFAPPAPQGPQRPPSPPPPVTTSTGGISRRTAITLIAGIVALIAVIVAAVGISALSKDGPATASSTPESPTTSSSPATSTSPTSAPRSYGAQTLLPFGDLQIANGVAVDSAGNVYVTSGGDNRVLKLAVGSSSPAVLPVTGLKDPSGVAVDGSGALYITAIDNNRVVKLAAGTSAATELPFSGLNNPSAVAVDSVGNVYLIDNGHNRVLKLAAGTSSQTELPFTGLNKPSGVAVDSNGNVYVTDLNNRVLRLAAGSSSQTVLPFTGLNQPMSVAVDSNGNVYVTDFSNNRVLRLAAGSTTPEALPFTGLNKPLGVAVDSTGNVYITDLSNHVLKLPLQ
jgi:serine/threonine-protein kinase